MIEHVHHFELEPAGLAGIAVPQRHHAAVECRVEQNQRAIARDTPAMANDPMSGIDILPPAEPIVGLAEPLEKFAKPTALARRLDQRLVYCREQRGRKHRRHVARLGDHPKRHVLDIAVDPARSRNPVIGFEYFQRLSPDAVRASPAGRTHQPRPADAGRGHPDGREQLLLERLFIAFAGRAGDDVAGRVIGDVLIAPASPRRTNGIQSRKLPAKELGRLPLLELVVERVAIKTEPMAEEVANGRAVFGSAGQLQPRGVVGDRAVEVDLALLGKLDDHRRSDPLAHRGPAKDGLGRDLFARSGKRLPITVEKGDPTVLDDPDRHSDHRRTSGHSLQPGVERGIIDVAPLLRGEFRKMEIGGGSSPGGSGRGRLALHHTHARKRAGHQNHGPDPKPGP